MKYYLASSRYGRSKATLKFSSQSGEIYEAQVSLSDARVFEQGKEYSLPSGAKKIRKASPSEPEVTVKKVEPRVELATVEPPARVSEVPTMSDEELEALTNPEDELTS